MKKLTLGKLSINKQVVSVLTDKQSASVKGGIKRTWLICEEPTTDKDCPCND